MLVADNEPAVKAVQGATSGHPIIFWEWGTRLDRSDRLLRPTGRERHRVANLDLEVSRKRLQLFKDLIPGLKRVLLPYDKHNYDAAQAELYRTAAQRWASCWSNGSLRPRTKRARRWRRFEEDIDGMLAPRDVSLNIPGLVLEFAQRKECPRCSPARSIGGRRRPVIGSAMRQGAGGAVGR